MVGFVGSMAPLLLALLWELLARSAQSLAFDWNFD